jgi:hypothetical protein
MGRDRKISDSDAEKEITRMMAESGKRDELRDKLLDHLNSSESGWRDQVILSAETLL